MGTEGAQRRLNAKSLPKAQAATVLALKSLTAEEDVRTIQLVCELASWGTRPTLITRLVGNAAKATVKAMAEKAHGRRRGGGKMPTTIGEVMAKPMIHLEASIFLRRFIGFQRIEGGGKTADPHAFIHAYRDYRAAIMWKTGLPPRVSPEQGFLVADQYAGGDAIMSSCPECTIHFLQSATSINISYQFGRGACPYCRQKRLDNRPGKSRV